MAFVADLDLELRFVGKYDKMVATCTCHFALYIFWMDALFHLSILFDYLGAK